MANKLFKGIKGIKEKDYTSISKHNAQNGSRIILFDPPNLTSFKCVSGYDGEKQVYIKESLACMWGNEEIEEYAVVDKDSEEFFAVSSEEEIKKSKQEYKKAKVGDVVIEYTHKSGMFSRFFYNVWFEYDGTKYYLFIKTCDGKKFKKLMEDFILKAII